MAPAIDNARLVGGRRNVEKVLAEVGDAASVSRLSLLPQPVPVGQSTRIDQAAALARRGVGVREVYLSDQVSAPDRLDALSRMVDGGIAVRVAPVVPIAMIVVDRDLVVLPLEPDRPGAALVVLRSAPVAHLAGLVFQDIWQHAVEPLA